MSDVTNNEPVRQDEPSKQEHQVHAPAISLPKGGGAIRGMGEKFAANPVTGTGSLTVPIFTSPGRSGFGPQLSLSYDSGAGNGPFGFGWNLSLPSITRKTDKGLPRYLDAEASDEFILSGAEDLVPELKTDGKPFEDKTTFPGYTIHRYRPRIEGLFARIERWTSQTDPYDIFWRSISRDGITTWYGKDASSHINDPANPTRIFSWLICESSDDKGNAIVYEYASENSAEIDLSQTCERNRTEECRSANIYLKRIKYGNTVSRLLPPNPEPPEWLFEAVFDYDEGHYEKLPLAPEIQKNAQHRYVKASSVPTSGYPWCVRPDPFSSYRAGFEVRTYRLCQRVLMFHYFAEVSDVAGADCLVRSTDFTYRYEPGDTSHPVHTFLMSVTQSGYIRQDGEIYMAKSMPPLEFEYSQAVVQDQVQEIDPKSLENLPYGLDGTSYQWVDLDGEGVSGILTEQAGGWFYKPNLSPVNIRTENGTETIEARFGPIQQLAKKPSLAAISSGRQQLIDLAGDGQLDLVELEAPVAGFYERTQDEGWESFRSFEFHPNLDWGDSNLKFVDLTGDGHADILVTEDEVLTWYASLAESGFAPAQKVRKALQEEQGPRLVFADRTQSIYLADLSGDGLTDLVRIRNGAVCYWPNLGYCRFGAKVTMDNAPWFDSPDLFDQRRIRLADIDGSGPTDIIYLAGDGVHLYFNQSGNRWSDPNILKHFPRIDNIAAVTVADLLGNGTACLVWSSPLPGNAQQSMRYIDLMGAQKPHLLVKTVNNLGVETHVRYAPSTRFYLADKLAGTPWITKIPFPVHVVERVETYDHVSRNRFVTSYAYHHGYYDGIEREFRGFGMVEQMDTEIFTALEAAENIDETSHVPPVLTRIWFHTGAWGEGEMISRQYEQEYYREGETGLDEDRQRALLLDDTLLPHTVRRLGGLEELFTFSPDETREAVRSLKGAILRQEIYALDGTEEQDRPYSVSERNYTIACLQPREKNPHAVFFTHARETIDFHYERKLFPVVNGTIVDAGTAAATPDVQWLADPRVTHAFTLAVDEWGNVKQAVAVGYGRRFDDPALSPDDQAKQKQILITYTENQYARFVSEDSDQPQDFYRAPPPCEARTFEVFNVEPSPVLPDGITPLFGFAELEALVNEAEFTSGAWDIPYHDVNHTQGTEPHPYRRLIEQVRSLYRHNDLSGPCPLGEFNSLLLPYESYKLAFTPDLLTQVYQRRQADVSMENLLSNPAAVLGNTGSAGGGYVDLDGNQHWWIPSGKIYFSVEADTSDPARIEQEQAEAQEHFYLPKKFTNPFGNSNLIVYDNYDLLTVETKDALENIVSTVNDYRVLQPRKIIDPNGNRSEVAFDALGLVAGTAVMGKEFEPDGIPKGDLLDSFVADLLQQQINDFFDDADPHGLAANLLGNATTRIVYDLNRFSRTRAENPDDPAKWQPAFAATLARETHVSDLNENGPTKIQIGFSYSDGFGREIQKKIQAEPEQQGGPLRWIGSGWTIYNNKGKPVLQYEPFFSPLPERRHQFEFGVQVGVSPILFYDPVGRVIATLHSNHCYEKVVFDPWRQETWDAGDTLDPEFQWDATDPNRAPNAEFDPANDKDVGDFFARLPRESYWPTWYFRRVDDAEALKYWPDQDENGNPIPENAQIRSREKEAARKTEAYANTPAVAHFDSLGRSFLIVAHNRVRCQNHARDGSEENVETRVEFDIEGNQRAVRDAIEQAGDRQGRIVMRYDYDLLGNNIHQSSMEAGERWMLNDVTGKPIRAWDSRGHNFATGYDSLRRPVEQTVRGTTAESDPRTLKDEPLLVDKIEYGESQPNPEALNLRTRIFLHKDPAGITTNTGINPVNNQTEAYDFKGNPLRSTRQLVSDYTAIPDWLLNPILDDEIFTGSTRYDALNRPIQSIAPHSSLDRAKLNILQPVFNEANLLERVDVWLDRDAEPNKSLDPDNDPPSRGGIGNIDYDAKGQRQRIDYKNGASTLYDYDPLTFRLVHLLTRRDAASFPGDCPQPPPTDWPGCQVQNLSYTYDPAGNITHIQDDAQQTIYFKNQRIEPSNDYTYDAIHRLIAATGREHLGQAGGSPIPHSHNDAGRTGIWNQGSGTGFQPDDRNAMGSYCEKYSYDAAGNFIEMSHHRSCPDIPSWTRSYAYNEASLIENGAGSALLKTSNRLTSTTLNDNGNNPILEPYLHDAHGNMVRMPHLGGGQTGPNMYWDYRDQLSRTDLGGGGTAYYVYDASGQRVRKVWEKAPGLIEERIYLGGFEIFRKHNGAIGADTATLERETLHIMDDKQRIALVETRTLDKAGNDPAPAQLIRYQFGNHLGSASLELDEWAQIISYEEYTPYGSSSYQAVHSKTETAKRYRYTGKERDEESGFYYYGARYYVPWLGSWISCDLLPVNFTPSSYRYTSNNPIKFIDKQGKQESLPIFNDSSLQRLKNMTLEELNSYFNSLEHPPPKLYQGRPLSQEEREESDRQIQWRSDVEERWNNFGGDIASSPLGTIFFLIHRAIKGPYDDPQSKAEAEFVLETGRLIESSAAFGISAYAYKRQKSNIKSENIKPKRQSPKRLEKRRDEPRMAEKDRTTSTKINTTGLSLSSMAELAFTLYKNDPLLLRLTQAQKLTGEALQRELVSILMEFEQTTGISVQIVDKGLVQAARGPGDFASLRTKPGVYQIERQAFRSSTTLLKELTHQLSAKTSWDYLGSWGSNLQFGESPLGLSDFIEMTVELGTRLPFRSGTGY